MNPPDVPGRVIFDFCPAGPLPAWQIVNDDVMGGRSMGRFKILTTGGAVFSGEVSLENNGGFASVRLTTVRQNLAGFNAFRLRVRGDNRRYKFTVRTETGFDTPLYQCAFTTKSGQWEEHRLPFADFLPTFRGRILTEATPFNPASVESVGFLISDKQAGAFELEIATILATRGESSKKT